MLLLLPPTLFLLLSLPLTAYSQSNATDKNTDTCNPAHNGLATGTLQYNSDCNATTWCNNGVCQDKGCRRDEFPLGYPSSNAPNPKHIVLPDKCKLGQFCPDEGSSCQDLTPVGQPCQLDRDDSCQAPPNFEELRDTSGHGRNVNGSVCLNFACQWANITSGSTCEIENVGYIAYGSNGQEFVNVVSRDNCRLGLYCDTNSTTCLAQKDLGASCQADKECSSFNCEPNNVCGADPAESRHFSIWIYIISGIGIFGGMFGTLFLLFFLHSRERDSEREKRLQYWREQNAFRQNILQMGESVRMGGIPGSQRSRFGITTEDSQMPMLQNAAPRGSGQRYYVGDDLTETEVEVEQEIEHDQLAMRTPYTHLNRF